MRNVLLIILFISFPSFAYIDPNIGSMLLQALLAMFAAFAATIGIYWSKIRTLFLKIKNRNKSIESEDKKEKGEK